jgi:hypothetical protein
MLNSYIKAALVAAVLAVPAVSFAQSNQPVTREQVRAELAQLEKAGYNPNDYLNYPANLQHAEAIVAQQNTGNTAYGPATSGVSQSGK